MNVIIGSLGISKYTGCLSPVYYVLRTRMDDDLPRYFTAVFQNPRFHKSLVRIGNGILAHRMRIPMEKLKCEMIPVPPPDEQALIVRFLDWASVRLGKAIAAKRKVIGLLEEQKQAIIHRAVTRGLDENVKRNCEHAPWLGELPSNWPVFRAKLLFHQVRPEMPENAQQVTCFRDGQVTLRSNRRTTGFTNAIWELGYQGIYPGQLVLHSMDAFAGAIGVSDSTGKCSPEYVICEPSMDGISSDYYALLLRSLAVRGFFVMLCPSVRQRAPRVRYNDFGSFILPKPSESEQREIVGYVKNALKEIESSILKNRRSIELLIECRTRLVADVVTGKLDVREFARSLPDDVSEEVAELAATEALDEDFATDDEMIEEAV
ncbi:restriction endonuclease subunit S [Rhodopirellula sallentina]|nr:restriction endonuclease subunit S [Rhodopirellula sallentina]